MQRGRFFITAAMALLSARAWAATPQTIVDLDFSKTTDLDKVMTVMDHAFDRRFGEAWTRSQLGGIMPMAGVSLILAREPASGRSVPYVRHRTEIVRDHGLCGFAIKRRPADSAGLF